MQVGVEVLFGKEAGLTVVPVLHDVQRHFIKMNARVARHGLQPDSFLRQVVLALRHKISGQRGEQVKRLLQRFGFFTQ